MSLEELKALLGYVGAFGVGAAFTLVVAWWVARTYLSPYLSKKAENLATREDIAAITARIEDVKVQYSLLIEDRKASHQLRVAALGRRLQAHQEAFTLWRELLDVTHSQEVGKAVLKCQEWWEKNCLYLEPRVRGAFVDAYSAAHLHNSLVQGRVSPDDIKTNWARIIGFPDVLFAAIQLPPLSESEAKSLLPNRGAG